MYSGGLPPNDVLEDGVDDSAPLGFGTALQILSAFVPSPKYPFIVVKAFFISSSLPKRTKPYPLLNPLLSKITTRKRLRTSVCVEVTIRTFRSFNRVVLGGEYFVEVVVVYVRAEIADPHGELAVNQVAA